jgi:hypothetical protein
MSDDFVDRPATTSRKPATSTTGAAVPCPRCGRAAATIIGGSESFAVLYLRCRDCQQMSVAPA